MTAPRGTIGRPAPKPRKTATNRGARCQHTARTCRHYKVPNVRGLVVPVPPPLRGAPGTNPAPRQHEGKRR